MTSAEVSVETKGRVVSAFGNLLQIEFQGPARQGGVVLVHAHPLKLKGEILEIQGQMAKVQVFEDTSGIQLDDPVEFLEELLEVELGPGLLSSIVDGLQNPLENLARESGQFLPRGRYLPPLDRGKKWDYQPVAELGQTLRRGDPVGVTREGKFEHVIMLPFSLFGTYRLTWVASPGQFTIVEPIARVEDSAGNELTLVMLQKWPAKLPLVEGKRILPTEMMDTGLRIIDTQFPLLKGSTFCTPGPFGAGKTVLQHHLARYSSVDIVVMVACGERAGEVVEVLREFPHLTDPHTGDHLMSRTVVICNTSSMPVAARESSIYIGTAIAEYYRQMGKDILLLADSTSRWAQALRELSGRLEEIPGDEAFPAYLASRVAEFYQRSGALRTPDGRVGSLTIGGAVSPAGGNFEEPVTQATLAVVGAFLGLARERSDARKYPAIDPLISWSKYRDRVGQLMQSKCRNWNTWVKRTAQLLERGDEISKRMEVVGEEGTLLPDFILCLKAETFDAVYLQQNAFDREDAYATLERQVALFELINTVVDSTPKLTSHDEARSFFLKLQGLIKNLNTLPLASGEYSSKLQEIRNFSEISTEDGRGSL